MSKSTFLFMGAPQNSYQLYIKEKKNISANSAVITNCYLCVVRERITSARMHQ